MTKKGSKPRFVVDQNIYDQEFVEKYGSKRARFYSVKDVTGNVSSEDPEILEKSAVSGKHIITKNAKHFERLLKSKPQYKKIGIVGIGIKSSNFINKFGEVLDKLPYHEDYEGKFVKLGNKLIIKNRAATS